MTPTEQKFTLGQTVQILGMNTPLGEYVLLGRITKITTRVEFGAFEPQYHVLIHKTQKELPFVAGQLMAHEENELPSLAQCLMNRDPFVAKNPDSLRSAIRKGLMGGPMRNVDLNIEQCLVDWMADRFLIAHTQAVGDEAKAAIRALWEVLTNRKFQA